jgi:hypothetical protein
MTIGVGRPHLDPLHEVAAVSPLNKTVRVEGLGEAGPATSAVEFVHRGEKRFPRNNVDVDAGLMIVAILAGERTLRAVLLGNVVLLGAQRVDRGRVLAVLV